MYSKGWYKMSRFACLMRVVRSNDLVVLRIRHNFYYIEITPYIGLSDRYDFYICCDKY